MPCGLEPHQYDLHEHLFRGRHAGHIPLGRRMGALRLAGRRGCRSAAHRRLAVAHAPQRKIASAQSSPVRSAAVFRPYTRDPSQPHTPAASRSASAEPHRFCRCVRMISSLQLQPPLAPVLRPGMPPGLSATESQTRFRTRLPLHRTLRLLYPRRFRRTPRSDVAPEGPNYPKTASERYKQFYLSIN